MRKLRSPISSSSRTSVAVRPSLQWALMMAITCITYASRISIRYSRGQSILLHFDLRTFRMCKQSSN